MPMRSARGRPTGASASTNLTPNFARPRPRIPPPRPKARSPSSTAAPCARGSHPRPRGWQTLVSSPRSAQARGWRHSCRRSRRTIPTAPKSKRSVGRQSPTNECFSGTIRSPGFDPRQDRVCRDSAGWCPSRLRASPMVTPVLQAGTCGDPVDGSIVIDKRLAPSPAAYTHPHRSTNEISEAGRRRPWCKRPQP